MRIGVVDLLWWPSRIHDPTFFPEIRSLGIDAIEIAVADAGSLDHMGLREAAELHGLTVSLLVWTNADSDISDDRKSVRDRGIRHLTGCIDAAHEVGAGIVAGAYYGPLLSSEGPSRALWSASEREARLRTAGDSLRQLAHHAAERGVTLALEPLNRFEGRMLNNVYEALEFLDGLSAPSVGVLLDTFHMHIEESSPSAAIKAAAGRIAHVHVSENTRGAPGQGQIDWTETMTALTEAGFDGTIVIESFSDDALEIREACAMWRPQVGDPREFVRRGVNALRTAHAEALVNMPIVTG